jgi:pyruvate/2-oxoglutarate dehydrogenase complex dihydrolipoamide acyltransferase (E2) component
MIRVRVPTLGEGITDATVSFWHVEEGDHVEAGDDVVEMATDKATFNIPAPCRGVIAEVFFEEGESAKVGDVLATIEEEPEKGKKGPV